MRDKKPHKNRHTQVKAGPVVTSLAGALRRGENHGFLVIPELDVKVWGKLSC